MQSPNLHPQDNGFRFEKSGSALPRKRRGRLWLWLGIGGIILGLAFLVSVTVAYKFYSTSKRIIRNGENSSFLESMKSLASKDHKILRGENEGRINILLVGLAGKNYPGANLTDSIIVASINPKTFQTALLSIPRDFYVQIPGTKSFTKINALYARSEDTDESGKTGIDDLKETVSNITGLPINYYIALDFDGFRQIIGELGGVNIQVPKTIHDERYPGPNYSYQTFEIGPGLQELDGETALKYARTRHDEDGDFGRAFRQQQILEAARSKAYSLGTILNIPKLNEILDTLGEHLRTDIQLDELYSFLELLNKIDTHTTINKVLDAGKPDSVMAVSHVYLGGVRAFTLVPRTGDFEEIRDIADNIFDLESIARKKQEIEQEGASVAIINASGVPGFEKKLGALLNKLGYAGKIQSRENRTSGQTVVYDNTSGIKPYSLEDLHKKFAAGISDSPLPLNVQCKDADFCLMAGSDLVDRLNFEENTLDDLEKGYDQQQIDEKSYIDLLKKGSSRRY